MNSVVEIETSEAEVTVVSVTAAPPSITIVHEGRDSNRMRRSFVQQVPMRDANLVNRVLLELHEGDQIQVTVVNEWRKDGCDTYLTDFNKFAESNQKEAVKQNGAMNFVYNDTKQIVVKSIPQSKTEVRK